MTEHGARCERHEMVVLRAEHATATSKLRRTFVCPSVGKSAERRRPALSRVCPGRPVQFSRRHAKHFGVPEEASRAVPRYWSTSIGRSALWPRSVLQPGRVQLPAAQTAPPTNDRSPSGLPITCSADRPGVACPWHRRKYSTDCLVGLLRYTGVRVTEYF